MTEKYLTRMRLAYPNTPANHSIVQERGEEGRGTLYCMFSHQVHQLIHLINIHWVATM